MWDPGDTTRSREHNTRPSGKISTTVPDTSGLQDAQSPLHGQNGCRYMISDTVCGTAGLKVHCLRADHKCQAWPGHMTLAVADMRDELIFQTKQNNPIGVNQCCCRVRGPPELLLLLHTPRSSSTHQARSLRAPMVARTFHLQCGHPGLYTLICNRGPMPASPEREFDVRREGEKSPSHCHVTV